LLGFGSLPNATTTKVKVSSLDSFGSGFSFSYFPIPLELWMDLKNGQEIEREKNVIYLTYALLLVSIQTTCIN
jgi:hypothetical protein